MKFLLYPFSLLYGFVIWIRNFLFDLEIIPIKEFDVPIISVGNISVGGTGKTPHIEYLLEKLLPEKNIAVVSRGYKRKTKGFLKVESNMNVDAVGDEPLQIKQKFPESCMVVDEKRVHAIQTLLSDEIKEEIEIILLDDAYQHRYVKPGLNILLVDYNNLIQKDHLLPFGRLREPVHEKKRANIIIVTKCPDELTAIEQRIIFKDFDTFPYQNLFYTKTSYQNIRKVFNTAEAKPLNFSEIKDASIYLITGIANANPLLKFLKTYNKQIEHFQFPDHYFYKEKDLDKILEIYNNDKQKNKLILTTEKDSKRLLGKEFRTKLEQYPFYFVSIKIEFLNQEEELFLRLIKQYIYSNKRPGII